MRFSKKDKIVEVVHPNFSEVKLRLKKLTRMETIEYLSSVEAMRVPTPVKDQATGEYVKEGNEIKVIYRDQFNYNVILDLIEKALKSWEGIEDEEGNVLHPVRKNFFVLFDEQLDVTQENGEKESFWAFIMSHIQQENIAGIEDKKELDPK